MEQFNKDYETLTKELRQNKIKQQDIQNDLKAGNKQYDKTVKNINNWVSLLANKVLNYQELSKQKTKSTNQKELSEIAFNRIDKLSKKEYTSLQLDSLLKEIDNHRRSKLQLALSLQIAATEGTLSSVVINKNKLATLTKRLNWEDYSRLNETERHVLKQEIQQYIKVIGRLKENIILELLPIEINTLEQTLNNTKDISDNKEFNDYRDLLNTLLTGIRKQYDKTVNIRKTRIETEQNIDNIINAINIKDNFTQTIDDILILNKTFTPQGWIQVLNELKSIAKVDPISFIQLIDKYKKSFNSLVEKSKPDITSDLYNDLKSILSQKTVDDYKVNDVTAISDFVELLNAIQPTELVNNLFNKDFITVFEEIVNLETER